MTTRECIELEEGYGAHNHHPRTSVAKRLSNEGVPCKETHRCVIHIAPPLVITKEEIDWAFERIQKVITFLNLQTPSVVEKDLVWLK